MPRYAHPDTLDNGLAHIRANCNKLALISGYAVGDSYATVNAAILAEAAMAPADFTLGTSGSNRTLTTASGKSDPSANASGSGTTMHVAFLDTVGLRVLSVTPAPDNVTFAAGTPVAFGQIVLTARQPVVA